MVRKAAASFACHAYLISLNGVRHFMDHRDALVIRIPVETEKEPAMDTLSAEKVCYIIVKAREFDVKVDPVAPDPGSNPADDDELDILEDFAADPTYDELTSAIRSLNRDEQVELVALAWTGRGDYTAAQWAGAVSDALDAHNNHTAEYLTGIPLLGDYLEEGLSALGYSCEEYQTGRL